MLETPPSVRRLLILAPPVSARGPVAVHTPLLVDALRKRGLEVCLLPWGAEGLEGPVSRLRSRLSQVVVAVLEARRGLYDAVVVKTAHDDKSLARDAALVALLGNRVILQLQGSEPERIGPDGGGPFTCCSRFIAKRARGLLVLSTQEEEEWRTRTRATRVAVVKDPYPVDTDRAAGLKSSPPTLLYVGRILRPKGAFDLVEACSALSPQDCRLVIAGDGPDFPELQRLVARSEANVELIGYVTGAALRAAYDAADVFVFPSYWPEGFPTVIIEAMEAGLPVITTRYRGMADYLAEPNQAIFVPPRDPAALAQAIRRLLAEPAARVRMGAANRRAVTAFAVEQVVPEYLDAVAKMYQ